MENFNKADDPIDSLILDDLLNFECPIENPNLVSQHNVLNDNYAKEIENCKKVKKCLSKCLRFYSKLFKKYEAQQKIIAELEKTNKEKIINLEESLKNLEKMKGLIDIHKKERIIFQETSYDLKRDKEILLDICCKLIAESVKTNNIRTFTNLILQKFKKDLNNEKLHLLKGKSTLIKEENDTMCSSICKTYEGFKIPTSSNKLNGKDEKNPNGNIPYSENKTHKSNIEENITDVKVNKFNNVSTIETKFENVDNVINKNELPEMSTAPNHLQIEQNNLHDLKVLPYHESQLLKSTSMKDPLSSESTFFKDLLVQSSFRPPMEVESKSVPLLEISLSAINKNNKTQITSSPCSLESNQTPALKVLREDDSMNDFNDSLCEKMSSSKGKIRFESINLKAEEETYSIKKNFTKSNCSMRKELVSSVNSLATDTIKISNSRGISKNNFEKEFPTSAVEDLSRSNGEAIFENICNLEVELSYNKVDNTLQPIRGSQESGKDCKNSENCFATNASNSKNFSISQSSGSEFLQNCYESVNKNCLKSEIQKIREKNLQPTETPISLSIFDVPAPFENSQLIHSNNSKGVEETDVSENFCVNDTSVNINLKPIVNSSREQYVISGLDFSKNQEFSDEDLSPIFREMSCVRLLSPIRETKERKRTVVKSLNSGKSDSLTTIDSFSPLYGTLRNKRNCSRVLDNLNKKPKMSNADAKEDSKPFNLLDSIMSKMSVQNEQIKSNKLSQSQGLKNFDSFSGSCDNSNIISDHLEPGKTGVLENNKDVFSEKKDLEKPLISKKMLTNKIQKFISTPITSKEDAEKSVQECASACLNQTVDVIAGIVVNLVLENVDEKVENFAGTVPPMTFTQNRLTILLSVVKLMKPGFENILNTITEKITEKLFPDKFHWPDDAVEMACVFYTALCKLQNDAQSVWKFFVQAMTEMRRRSFLIIFSALKIWPDILHNASTIKNNILAVTIVNIFLHMPKTPPQLRQREKLGALKNLLMMFYGFKVDDTIENYAQYVLEEFFKEEASAHKSLVLLCSCRDVNWTVKHVFPKLKIKLIQWSRNECSDILGHKILAAIKYFVSNFPDDCTQPSNEASEVISCLSEVLKFGKINHDSEVRIIQVLLELKQYPIVRSMIREWIPKGPIDENLKNEIVSVSAENILRELKFNRRKDMCLKKNLRKIKKNKLKGSKDKKTNKKKNKQKKDRLKKKSLKCCTVVAL